MPVQVAVHTAEAGVAGQPVADERDPFIGVTIFVADMRVGMRDRPVVPIAREGALDDTPSLGVPAGFRDRHAVMGAEPPVVAVCRGEPVEERRQFLNAAGAARNADEAELVGGGGEDHRVGGPAFGVGADRGEGITVEQHLKHADMAGLALVGGACGGSGNGLPRGRYLAAELQQPRFAGMRQGEVRIGLDCPIERATCTGIEGQQQIAGLSVGFRRGVGLSGQRKAVAVGGHGASPGAVRSARLPLRHDRATCPPSRRPR